MRSVKYARDVVNKKVLVPESVINSAYQFKQCISAYEKGDIECEKTRERIKNAIDYERRYLQKDINQLDDYMIFAITSGIINRNFLYMVPRKNGKTTWLFYIMYFIHNYYDNVTVGLYGDTRMFIGVLSSQFVWEMRQRNIMCRTKDNVITADGKNNKYILLSEKSPSNSGKKVDVLLIDEVLRLSDLTFNNISFDYLKMASSFHSQAGLITVDDVKTYLSDDDCGSIMYFMKPKKFKDISFLDMVVTNPALEAEISTSRGVLEQYIPNVYARAKYQANVRDHFMVAHLNMNLYKTE